MTNIFLQLNENFRLYCKFTPCSGSPVTVALISTSVSKHIFDPLLFFDKLISAFIIGSIFYFRYIEKLKHFLLVFQALVT